MSLHLIPRALQRSRSVCFMPQATCWERQCLPSCIFNLCHLMSMQLGEFIGWLKQLCAFNATWSSASVTWNYSGFYNFKFLLSIGKGSYLKDGYGLDFEVSLTQKTHLHRWRPENDDLVLFKVSNSELMLRKGPVLSKVPLNKIGWEDQFFSLKNIAWN